MEKNIDINSTMDGDEESNSLSAQIIFYILLSLVIPSVLISFILFYYFLRLPEFRQDRYSYHTIIYLMISSFLIDFIDTPVMLPHFQRYYFVASVQNPILLCIVWIIYNFCSWSLNLWMVALFSIERYLLIFFKQIIMRNKKRRFCLYYASPTLIGLFIFLWYLYFVAFYPCSQTEFDYTQYLCGSSCYQTTASDILLNLDWVITGLLPVFLTVLFNIILILHVLYQRHKISRHLAHQETWKRTRKMFLQLLPITLAFIIFTLPVILLGVLSILDPWYGTTPYYYAFFLSYGLPLFIPFIVLWKQRKIQRRLLEFFRPTRFNRLAPMIITVQTARP